MTKRRPLLKDASRALQGGKIIVYPTETFYALGAALDQVEALKRVFLMKGRDPLKPLPFIACSLDQALGLFKNVTPALKRLTASFWPGPLTIVAKASQIVPPYALAEDGTIALRVSSHPLARALVKLTGVPVSATSANPSGQPPFRTIKDIPASWLQLADLVLDGGQLIGGLPSTIILIEGDTFRVLREGALPSSALTGPFLSCSTLKRN
jgi:L-threonylcarbamoyladenylate synthase